METKKLELKEKEFIELMNNYAENVRGVKAKFRIENGTYKGNNEYEDVKPRYYYEVYKEGSIYPSRLPIYENDITTIINEIFNEYEILNVELQSYTSKTKHNPMINIPTSGPRPLTQEEMRMARHPEMYSYWNITSSFIGTKITYKEKQDCNNTSTNKVLQKVYK